VVGAPVETEFGFHVIEVTERGVPDFEDVQQQVASALAQEVEAAFGEWFQGAIAEAEVTVDERYGTWNATDGAIQRPASGDDLGDPSDSSVPTGSTGSTDATVPDEG
jgi:hypothetical protein